MSSSRQPPSIDDQRQFWDWHWQNWEDRKVLNAWTERRAKEILTLIQRLGLSRPRILDLGCGRGWFTERLADLGEAHGIDLSPDAVAAAQARRRDIKYQAGNIYQANLPKSFFDIVVSQEVIAHVEDQAKYLELAADVLKVRGHLIITTGNKWVMDRLGDVGWNVQPAQHIANQLSRQQLKKMLAPRFKVLRMFTIIPHGKLGLLRLVNSHKLNSSRRLIVPLRMIVQLKVRAGFGWQLIFLAQKER